MSSKQSSTKITVLFFLVVIGVAGWYAAPLFLPVWAWSHIDLEKIAAATGETQTSLEKEFSGIVWYHPRGRDKSDPAPWVLLEFEDWAGFEGDAYPDWYMTDELGLRCALVCKNTGKPPSTMLMGGTEKDRFFSIKGNFLPEGSVPAASVQNRLIILYNTVDFNQADPDDIARLQYEVENDFEFDDEDVEFPWYPVE